MPERLCSLLTSGEHAGERCSPPAVVCCEIPRAARLSEMELFARRFGTAGISLGLVLHVGPTQAHRQIATRLERREATVMTAAAAKTIYITGGASGMGLLAAKMLAALGAHIVVLDLNPTDAAFHEVESARR